MLPKNIVDVIDWPIHLSDSLIKQLTFIGEIKENLTNKQLDNSEIAHQGITFIVEGTATICLQTPSLKTVNNIVMGKGDWFGNYDIIDTSYTPFFISEVDQLTLVHFKNSKLKKISENTPEAYKWFHSLFFTAKDKWLQSQLIMFENITIRVVYLLIELSVHQKYIKGETPKIMISQQHISRITGITRQRVNETIKQLEKKDLLYLARGCIYLSDLKRLYSELNGVDLSVRDPRKIR